jgi:hypothetical protein
VHARFKVYVEWKIDELEKKWRNSWRGLIPQNQTLHSCFELEIFTLPSYIKTHMGLTYEVIQ